MTNFSKIIAPTLFAFAALATFSQAQAALAEMVGKVGSSPNEPADDRIYLTSVHVDQHHGTRRLREPRRYRTTRRRNWKLDQRRFTGDHCLVRFGRQLSPSRYCYPRYNRDLEF